MTATLALFIVAHAASASPTSGTISIAVTGLRSTRGTVRACLTRSPSHFPDCSRDPAALSHTVKAGAASIEFSNVPSGDYAIALFHDENDNGKLDTFLGIPKEGFGFSRNPRVSFGAPHFNEVDIKIAPGFSRLTVRMQYLL